MDEKKKFKVLNDKGIEVECEPLFTFESEETKKQYVVYTDNTLDETGNVRVFAQMERKCSRKEGEWRFLPNVR